MLGFGDPVADAIALLRPHTAVGPNLLAAGRWALRFDAAPHVRIGGLVRGSCWLLLDGEEPVLLQEGDTFLVRSPPNYVLASTLDATPQPARPLWESSVDGEMKLGVGDPHDGDRDEGVEEQVEVVLCSGHMLFDPRNARLLTDVLPPVLVVPAADPQGEEISRLIEMLAAEVAVDAAGGPLVRSHLAQSLLVYMLRAYSRRSDNPSGWLCALTQNGIGAALRALHEDVSHPWTLQEMADISHMSRSAFAQAFKRQVGVPPLEYLIQWRMALARDALSRDLLTIPELSRATGYRSESAFSTAFRRIVGAPPAKFRAQERASAPAAART